MKFSKVLFPLQSMLKLIGEHPPEVGVVKEHECPGCQEVLYLCLLGHKLSSTQEHFFAHWLSLRFARFFHRADTSELI